MAITRGKRAKWNIITSFLGQIITVLCGLVIPRLMVQTFGSEAYGATASIAQFLAYITLLEGGIGGVARAALYKPLAEGDNDTISAIMAELQRFFRIVAWIFLVYVLVLACSFRSISNVTALDWSTTFLLVVIISISTFAQYFIGITNIVLLQAAQRAYIGTIISISATVMNTILVVLLVNARCSLLTVKLVSSCIFVLRPVLLQLYVKKNFQLSKPAKRNKEVLSQKWTGLGQHIAYFLHSDTDIMVLTLFANLSMVAVYSVYNMVVSNIQFLTSSFTTGMEALFGDMLAKEEKQELDETFDRYEMLISVVALVMFATTMVLIMPFVQLYTDGITDADYWAPAFAVILILASLLYCLRIPYHSVVIAAGHFKQTNLASYGEAAINIVSSIMLVKQFGLIGVAVGTLVATGFRFLYYVIYLSRNIMYRSVGKFLKRAGVNTTCFLTACIIGMLVIRQIAVSNYLVFVFCGILTVCITAVVTVAVHGIFYHRELKAVIMLLLRKTKKGAA